MAAAVAAAAAAAACRTGLARCQHVKHLAKQHLVACSSPRWCSTITTTSNSHNSNNNSSNSSNSNTGNTIISSSSSRSRSRWAVALPVSFTAVRWYSATPALAGSSGDGGSDGDSDDADSSSSSSSSSSSRKKATPGIDHRAPGGILAPTWAQESPHLAELGTKGMMQMQKDRKFNRRGDKDVVTEDNYHEWVPHDEYWEKPEPEIKPLDSDDYDSGDEMNEDHPVVKHYTEQLRRQVDSISDQLGGKNAKEWTGTSMRSTEGMPLWMQYEEHKDSASEAEDDGLKVTMPPSRPRIRVALRDSKGRAYATGKRKTSVARVWVKRGEGNITVNRREFVDYFNRVTLRSMVLAPFRATNSCGGFDVWLTVKGGGISGQAGAIKHGISKALANYDPHLRPMLRKAKLLRRDPRQVERKKPGRKKARKKFTWVKR